MKRKLSFLYIVIPSILLLAITGCQLFPNASSQSNDADDVQNIQVNPVSAQKTDGSIEEFPLPNCGGTGKLTQSLGTQVSVSKSVEMGSVVKVSGGKEVGISSVAKLKLEASIEAAYKQVYDTANSRLDSIQMEAAPKTHVVYAIEWEKQVFSSVATFEANNELLKMPYTFIMNVPKIAGSREEECAPTLVSTESIEVPEPTIPPTATDEPPKENVKIQKPTRQEFATTANIWDKFSFETPTRPTTLVYNTTVNSSDVYRWGAVWCGKDYQILQNILAPLSMNLLVDGQPLNSNQIIEYTESLPGQECYRWGTILSDWKSGKVVQLELSYYLSRTIDDGYYLTEAGEYHLIINVDVR